MQKNKSNNAILKSFRMKAVFYCMFSLFLTVLTDGALLGVGYIIYHGTMPVQTMQETAVNDSKNRLFTNNNLPEINTIENFTNQATAKLPSQNFNPLLIIFLAAVFIVVSAALFVFYFLLFSKRFSDYLEEIRKGISELSNGSFETRIPIRNKDELTDIASNLNTMAESIRTIMNSHQRTENTKNELITSVAHDLRTPLTSIIGYLELVLNQELTPEIRTQYIEIAYNKSKRLEKLINDLFTYTKYEFGEARMNYTKMDLVKLMEQLLDEFYPSFVENELEYQFTTNEPSILLYGDGDQLARAFANLIGNAIKYGANGKNVMIRIRHEEEEVVVSIVNYGELIPQKDLQNIFDRFYRVDSSRNEELGGTGLGLAIAKSIIVLHQGRITAKSDFSGTVFEVVLPIVREQRKEIAEEL